MGKSEQAIRKLPFERRVEKQRALKNVDNSRIKLLVLHIDALLLVINNIGEVGYQPAEKNRYYLMAT